MAQHRSTRGLTYGGGGNGATNFSDGWGVAFGTGVDVPQGEFNSFFKPAINVNTSIYRFLGPLTVDFNVGYRNFQPDEPVVEGDGITQKNTNMPAFSASFGVVYNIDIADNFRVYGGVNTGAYFTNFGLAYVFDNGLDPIVFDGYKTSLYYAPKAGISFPLTTRLGINIESKYNFYTQKAESQTDPSDSRSANWNSFTIGAELVIKF
ncbi:hypothetical protein [Mucilaginibacter celer]|uniref:Outer membrane protein beta-barrel domain-containing protein n=1 Tax=Mucilaginibacter celer TaxID=2305508 RepID=A0A494VY16_9SPHI|nr:hypothetical protein [Mucilaginibacter celer]AYL96383.1 hypothetical protein HYN43_014240 [Mucilaginibacter celer]